MRLILLGFLFFLLAACTQSAVDVKPRLISWSDGTNFQIAKSSEEQGDIHRMAVKYPLIVKKLADGSEVRFYNIKGDAVVGDVRIGTVDEIENKIEAFNAEYWKNHKPGSLTAQGASMQQACTNWIAYSWWCGWTINWNNGVWPYSGVKVIPKVFISSAFTVDQANFIKNAFGKWEVGTKIYFNNCISGCTGAGVIRIERPFGGSCNSDLGYVGNTQTINLGFDNTNPDLSKRYDCLSQRTILHEMGHALGLYHENQRCDSGNYIVVNQNNALADFATNYQSYCDNRILSYGAYDFNSVMHYATNYFNSDITRPDILRKTPTGNVAITYTNKYYGVTYSPPRLDVIPSSGDVAVMNFRQP
jgi:hypothetical protein